MKILLIPNFIKPNSIPCAEQVVHKLRELGAVPMLDTKSKKLLVGVDDCVEGDFSTLLKECDVLLTIGGDGTILKAVQHAVLTDKPILGVNAGRIGFLSQVEMNELDALERLVSGNYRLSRRMLLEAEIVRKEGSEKYLALNEIVIAQGNYGKIVDISVLRDEQEITHIRADGLIFATPTGSTAYSLSVGGSIADPEIDLILLTAISPYSAFNRSLLLPADREYMAREENLRNQDGLQDGLLVMADGKNLALIGEGEYVRVRRASVYAQLIDLQLRDFYSNLHEKLSLRR